jgi:hypothetical protein
MADEPAANDDPASWLTPAQVLERAMISIPVETEARSSVWKRIRSGLIRSYALRGSAHRGRTGKPTPFIEPRLVTTDLWLKYSDRPHHLWRGEAEFIVHSSDSYRTGNELHIQCFDVRLNPADVEREFPSAPAVGPTSETEEPDEPERCPPVAQPDLEAWYGLFKRVYPDAGLDLAWRSARGMFQGKSVSRRRVNALLPTDRQRGRPRNR